MDTRQHLINFADTMVDTMFIPVIENVCKQSAIDTFDEMEEIKETLLTKLYDFKFNSGIELHVQLLFTLPLHSHSLTQAQVVFQGTLRKKVLFSNNLSSVKLMHLPNYQIVFGSSFSRGIHNIKLGGSKSLGEDLLNFISASSDSADYAGINELAEDFSNLPQLIKLRDVVRKM